MMEIPEESQILEQLFARQSRHHPETKVEGELCHDDFSVPYLRIRKS